MQSDDNVTRSFNMRDNNDFAPDANATVNTLDANTSINFVVASNDFTAGTATNLVRSMNVNRNVTMPTQPVQLTPISLQASDANVTGTVASNGVGNATFLYGRIHAPRYRFQCPQAQVQCNAAPLLYYESFCNNCDAATMALLPNGAASQLSLDSVNWYINAIHNAPIEGNVSLPANISQIGGAVRVQTTALNQNTPTQATLQYDGSRNYPYKTTMQATPSSWLVYNRFNTAATSNEFDVEFYKAGGDWTGQRETETTTDSTAAVTTNRRILW